VVESKSKEQNGNGCKIACITLLIAKGGEQITKRKYGSITISAAEILE
jgi:hypothetical protein